MATGLKTTWDGLYFDGRTSDRRPVGVTITRGALSLVPESGPAVWWPLDEVRQAEGGQAGGPVRLERGGELPEVLVVRDQAFLEAIHAVNPGLGGRVAAPGPPGRRRAVALGAAAGALVVGAVLYLWAIPLAAETAAGWVPISWEEAIGQTAVESGGLGSMSRCDSPAAAAALDRIVARLLGASPGEGYTYRITVVDVPEVNALAAPGGYLVLFDGLLRAAESPEELAGVLAHEIQHVERRHTTKMLVREVSAAALLAAATGDATQFATVLGAGRAFGSLHFSRAVEREADERGMRMLQAARVDPDGMLRFMRRLAEDEDDVPEGLRYLSTHPLGADRVEGLARLAREVTYDPVPVLDAEAWQALRTVCGERKAGEREPSGPAAPGRPRGKEPGTASPGGARR